MSDAAVLASVLDGVVFRPFRYGRLVVVGGEPPVSPCADASVEVLCDCGTRKWTTLRKLRYGLLSCGCFQKEAAAANGRAMWTTHGRTHTVEYKAWSSMKDRCFDEDNPSFDDYGGRGISVCAEWVNDFSAFFSEIGRRPGPDYSLDRIDNERGYEPGNVRWATPQEQQGNKRNNVRLSAFGQTKLLVRWAEELGVSMQLLHYRLTCMSVEEALSRPVQVHRRAGSA